MFEIDHGIEQRIELNNTQNSSSGSRSMKPHRTVLAVGGGMFILAAAAMLDMARVPAPEASVAARGDRLDISETSSCGSISMIAACADDAFADIERARSTNASMIQVFEKPGETILVRVKIGD
jgi:hypothetical protein